MWKKWIQGRKKSQKIWYFVPKIVFTNCEKKLF